MTDTPQATAITPHLVCRDAASAIDFYKAALGAEEVMRIPGPNGGLMHAAISIGGTQIFLVDENVGCGASSPITLGGSSVTFNVGVADVDGSMARAQAAGAEVKMPAEDQFWGDRYGVVEDPFGHRWAFVAPIRRMSEGEIREAAAAFA